MQHHQIKGSRSAKELMYDNMIVKHRAGSHSYGTSLPTSDLDIRGVFAADPINIRTPWFTVRETEVTEEEDTKLYELTHFMKLCLECNPNIIETLWVDPSDILYSTPVYDKLRSERKRLLSKKIAFTTSGYAIAQLKRIRGHNKWINNPQPEQPPQEVDFVSLVQWFGETKMMPSDFSLRKFSESDFRLVPYGNNMYGLYGYVRSPEAGFTTLNHTPYNLESGSLNVVFEGDRALLPSPGAVLKFNKAEYKLALQQHSQYWEWKKNRNKTRNELEENFGYDTKHAMHLVRLLRMGEEALKHGEIIVKRPDANELLDIRDGSWSYEEILEYAEDMDHQIQKVWYYESSLPKKPDIKFAANLLMELQDMVWLGY